MRVLNRKLLRELVASWGVLATVVAIIAIGVGCFVGMATASRLLALSQAAYYVQYQFADFWIELKKAPLTAVERAARLPGVARLDARITFDVILDVPGVERPLLGRLISAPPQRLDRSLNGVCIVRGAGFSADRDEEVILGESFARAHGLRPGDRLGVILNRRRESFVIAGTAISPEYVYMTRGEGDLLPDPNHFGILYVKEDYARDVLDFRDACNNVVGRLADAADPDGLLKRLEASFEPFGVLAVTPRERQSSHRFLSDEIQQQAVSATVIPGLFLLVAALVLNVLMLRLADRQRTVIGTLKALGVSDGSVLAHFAATGVVVGLAGGLAGALLGDLLARGMIGMYAGFFQFPRFEHRVYPDLLAAGLLVSFAFAIAGSLHGALAVLQLRPAEAMRPKPPARGGAVILERWRWLWRRLGLRTQLALRTLLRNPVRTGTGVAAMALSSAIVLLTFILFGSLRGLIDFQFERIAHSDADVGLRDEGSRDALAEVARLPGVDHAEPVFAVACRMRFGPAERRVTITGLSSGARLTTPLDERGRPLQIPPHGLLMTAKLAELLGVRAGDSVRITPIRGGRGELAAPVAGVAQSYIGLDCYADQRYLSRLMGESFAVSAVQTALNPAERGAFYREIKALANAQSLGVRSDARAAIEETFVRTAGVVYGILILFAGVIAFGAILNNSLVEISERVRDVSTLRVLGYTHGEVAGLFLRQTATVALVGFALSVPLSYWLAELIVRYTPTEQFRLPIRMAPAAVLLAAAIVAVFVAVAQLFVRRQLLRLDWAEGIKVKE